eukprot:4906708-Prymnesium_polylepis.1
MRKVRRSARTRRRPRRSSMAHYHAYTTRIRNARVRIPMARRFRSSVVVLVVRVEPLAVMLATLGGPPAA